MEIHKLIKKKRSQIMSESTYYKDALCHGQTLNEKENLQGFQALMKRSYQLHLETKQSGHLRLHCIDFIFL